jgi:cytochrome c
MKHSSSAVTFTMASVLFALLADAAVAAGDPGRGARDFRSCLACHSVTLGEHSTGPSLANLWSRKAGTAEGFADYSQALKGANVVWNESNLDKWLSDPRRFIPGTSMSFRGIKDAQERADVIAYLKTVSDSMAQAMPQQDGMMGSRHWRSR